MRLVRFVCKSYEFHSRNNETVAIYHLLTTLISLDFCRCTSNMRGGLNPFNILQALIASVFLPIIPFAYLSALHRVYIQFYHQLVKKEIINYTLVVLQWFFMWRNIIPSIVKSHIANCNIYTYEYNVALSVIHNILAETDIHILIKIIIFTIISSLFLTLVKTK